MLSLSLLFFYFFPCQCQQFWAGHVSSPWDSRIVGHHPTIAASRRPRCSRLRWYRQALRSTPRTPTAIAPVLTVNNKGTYKLNIKLLPVKYLGWVDWMYTVKCFTEHFVLQNTLVGTFQRLPRISSLIPGVYGYPYVFILSFILMHIGITLKSFVIGPKCFKIET